MSDKKWAIQQMLDGKIVVVDGKAFKYSYAYAEFYQIAGDCMGVVDVNCLPKDGYTLYEGNGFLSNYFKLLSFFSEKVELPREIDIRELEDEDVTDENIYRLAKEINEIIKYLKAKEDKA